MTKIEIKQPENVENGDRLSAGIVGFKPVWRPRLKKNQTEYAGALSCNLNAASVDYFCCGIFHDRRGYQIRHGTSFYIQGRMFGYQLNRKESFALAATCMPSSKKTKPIIKLQWHRNFQSLFHLHPYLQHERSRSAEMEEVEGRGGRGERSGGRERVERETAIPPRRSGGACMPGSRRAVRGRRNGRGACGPVGWQIVNDARDRQLADHLTHKPTHVRHSAPRQPEVTRSVGRRTVNLSSVSKYHIHIHMSV